MMERREYGYAKSSHCYPNSCMIRYPQDDGTPVSVFVFDSNQPPRRNLLPLAKNALRKLRTVRHPDVLRFIDAVDTDSIIYIMTERVQPLGRAMQSLSMKSVKDKEDWLVWGLHRISVCAFIVHLVSTLITT